MAESPFNILNNAAPDDFPCKTCPAECCSQSSVPLTRKEYVAILRYLRTMPRSERNRLSAQKRVATSCVFVDTENWRCSVYPAEPLVCRLFGYAPKLTCTHAPAMAKRMTDAHVNRQIAENVGKSNGEIGWMTAKLTWRDIKRDLLLDSPRERWMFPRPR